MEVWYFFQMFWKDGLFKTLALEYDLSCCIIWKDDISFSRKYDLILYGKWRMIFLKKNTWKYDIFFKCTEKMVLPKKIALEYDLSCIIWKDGIFFLKTWYFFLHRKWKMIFFKKYMEILYFPYICVNVTNMILPFCKKIKDDLLPKKYT